MELWDAYDRHGNKLPGVTLRRGQRRLPRLSADAKWESP